MTFSELENSIRDISSHIAELLKKARSNSTITEAVINSIDDNTYAHCEIRLTDSNIVCYNVPIKIHEDLVANGHMPGKGTSVIVEHKHEGMGAKILSISTSMTNFVTEASNGKGPSAIKGMIPKA